jgi:hypothetical protein
VSETSGDNLPCIVQFLNPDEAEHEVRTQSVVAIAAG